MKTLDKFHFDGMGRRMRRTGFCLFLAAAASSTMLTASGAQALTGDGEDPLVIFADETADDRSDTENFITENPAALTDAELTKQAELEDNAKDPFARQQALGAAERVAPIDGRSKITDENPYAAPGVRLGSFILRPSVEVGYSSSKTESSYIDSGTSALVTSSTTKQSYQNNLELLIDSDWSRHSFSGSIRGNVPVAISGEKDSATYDANGTLQLDISSTTSVTLGGQFSSSNVSPQSSYFQQATDPIVNPGVYSVDSPATRLISASGAVRQNFGRAFGELRTTISRRDYNDAKLNNGTSVSQSDLNNTDYSFALRGGYEVSAAFSPFVELSYGIRRMDESLDAYGIDRNANRQGISFGSLINLGEKLGGEVSLGFAREKIANNTYDAINAVTVASKLNWSPIRGTNVTLNTNTAFQPNGAAGSAGSVVYGSDLGVSHQLRSNLLASVNLAANLEKFSGTRPSQTTLTGTLGLTYNLNRYVALTGRLSREQIFSSDPVRRGNTTTGFVGVKLQR